MVHEPVGACPTEENHKSWSEGESWRQLAVTSAPPETGVLVQLRRQCGQGLCTAVEIEEEGTIPVAPVHESIGDRRVSSTNEGTQLRFSEPLDDPPAVAAQAQFPTRPAHGPHRDGDARVRVAHEEYACAHQGRRSQQRPRPRATHSALFGPSVHRGHGQLRAKQAPWGEVLARLARAFEEKLVSASGAKPRVLTYAPQLSTLLPQTPASSATEGCLMVQLTLRRSYGRKPLGRRSDRPRACRDEMDTFR